MNISRKVAKWNEDVQTWYLIGWQYNHQPIRIHVRQSLLTIMDINIVLLMNSGHSLPVYMFFFSNYSDAY